MQCIFLDVPFVPFPLLFPLVCLHCLWKDLFPSFGCRRAPVARCDSFCREICSSAEFADRVIALHMAAASLLLPWLWQVSFLAWLWSSEFSFLRDLWDFSFFLYYFLQVPIHIHFLSLPLQWLVAREIWGIINNKTERDRSLPCLVPWGSWEAAFY